ncbi:TMV resistance protein N [Morus notabilis]|uniref:TMV resistance protein N n=1 Tax=Morus notabilis TaxID=981085 RepID=UPI000CED5379|nr:TMV resistance protein N [Morus notabilis]
MAAGGSSSHITLKKIKYDGFISFRGEDTRSNFTSDLHSALSREKIKAFIDENDLKTGDEISPTLLRAIEESKLCLIILSEDYASSRWCLEELASESKLIDAIVDAVIKKLRDISTPRDDLKGLVGVVTRIEKIESLLHIGSLNVGPVGIWGIGGIGKTTLARAVFNRLSSQFEACSFLEDVREQWKKHGPNHLKNKIFSELMEGESSLPFTKDRLRKKRVLVVFDDVDDAEQFEQLVGDWFGPESKIIVTSRDQQVLRNIEVSGTYEVKELNHDDPLKLFSLHAFKEKSPTEKERELSKRAVNYAGGVPLALIVLGRHLYSKSVKEWESTLDKLQKIPDKKIHNVLKISYDSLDNTEKDIFLNIACFFKGKSKDFVEGILDGCGFFTVAGIKVLIDKALITIDMWNTLHMHDLLQMMAFEIVHVQSTDQEPRKGSRLWIADDIYHTFKYNRGIDTIEGISLDTSKLNEEISLTPGTFSQMCRLRLLMINERKVSLPQGPLPFPNSLRYMFRVIRVLPLLLHHLENLKSINLKGSRHLLRVPDLSMAPNIERIYLDFCENLVEAPSSFQYLNKLEDLSFTGCSSLCKLSVLPKNLGSLKVYTPSLEHKCYDVPRCLSCEGHISSSTRAYPQLPHFDWGPDCDHADIEINSKLEKFPEIMKTMECLKVLQLVCVAIKELPH